jgi:hypothetical protein
MSEPQFTQTKLDVQLEAIAMMVREASRFPNGGARIGIDTSRKIAYNLYEYMRQEGMIIQPGYGYVKKPRKTRSDKGKPRKKRIKRNGKANKLTTRR